MGAKTIDDIKKKYSTEDELKEDLKKDKVSLRDDVVEKLKKFFGIKEQDGRYHDAINSKEW